MRGFIMLIIPKPSPLSREQPAAEGPQKFDSFMGGDAGVFGGGEYDEDDAEARRGAAGGCRCGLALLVLLLLRLVAWRSRALLVPQADRVWAAVDAHMDERRRERREARLKEELEQYRASNPKITEQVR